MNIFDFCETLRKNNSLNKKYTLYPQLFRDKDDKGNFFFYDKDNNPVTHLSEMRTRTFFEDNNLRSDWAHGIRNNPDRMYKNIERVVDTIPPVKYDIFFKICRDFNLEGYISDRKSLKTQCTQAIFAFFMYSIGYDLSISPYLRQIAAPHQNEHTPHFNNSSFEDSPYFAQIIFDANNKELLNSTTFNFKNLNNSKRIVIEGPGGQGKSRFVAEIKRKASEIKFFSDIFCVELPVLIPGIEKFLASNRNISNSKSNILLSWISDNSSEKAEQISTTVNNSSKKPILLVLDGYNELYTSTNPLAIKLLTEEIERIGIEWKNAYIIITCRSLDDNSDLKLQYTHLSNYECTKLSGVPLSDYNNFLSAHPDLTDTVKELAKIPLYYNHLSSIENNIPATQYDLLMQIYNKNFCQANIDNCSYFAFYIVAPHIAKYIDKSSSNQISYDRINRIVRELKNKDLTTLFNTTLDLTGYTGVFSCVEIDSEKVCRILTQKGPLVACSDNNYKFIHDDIRDYLIAFFGICSIKTLERCYRTKDSAGLYDVHANLNVSVYVSKLIEEGLNLTKDTAKGLEMLYASVLSDKNLELNETSILYVHTAFLISDYLKIPYSRLKAPLHQILSKITSLCPEENNYLDILGNVNDILRTRCESALADIIGKECQYYRDNKDFVNALNLIKIAENNLPESAPILNQKAKILMYIHREIVVGNKPTVCMDLNTNDSQDSQTLYKNGFEILEKASVDYEFNLSSNLLGMLYSVPAPYLIANEYQHYDFVKAFGANYSTITTKKHQDYTRRELDYAIRQAVALILKGYVCLRQEINYSFNMVRSLKINAFVEGKKRPFYVDENSLLFAEDLLKLAEGEYANSLNYLRGLIQLHKGQKNTARELFVSEENSLLNQIVLNKIFHENYDTTVTYDNIKKWISDKHNQHGVLDGCHQIYWYCDAKNLELSIDSDNEERIKFFSEFEADLPEVYREIVDRLTCG